MENLLLKNRFHFRHALGLWIVVACLPSFAMGAAVKSDAVNQHLLFDTIIQGKVSSESGELLPGVNVVIKNTTTGTTTDTEGKYSLNIPAGKVTLVFSSVGYEKQEIEVVNRSKLDVILQSDTKALGEVVVVGYGTQQRKDITGSVASVKGSEMENQPVASADALLQGRAAGVQVVQNTGAPGGGVTVRIRGNTSLNAGNGPLYVVDGVPISSDTPSPIGNFGGDGINPLAAISPNDIESVEILKDAAASSIYGARGANGVVLITTKRGKAGNASFSFNAYTGVAQVKKKLALLNAAQEKDYIKNALLMAGQPVNMGIDTSRYDTDWQSAIFRDAPVSNYDLSLRGGSDKVKYAMSLGYYDQKGVIINTGYKRYNGRVNLDYSSLSRLKLGTSIAVSGGFRNRVPEGDNANSVLTNAIRILPTEAIYNTDGSYTLAPSGRPNPVAVARSTQFTTQDNRLIGNVYGEYLLMKNLSFRTSLGIDFLGIKDDYFIPSYISGGAARPSTTGYNQIFSWVNENTLTYQRTFAQHHTLSVLAGYSQQESKSQAIFASANQGSTDNIATLNAAAQPTGASSSNSNWGLVSYFGRLTYAFDDKYLFTTSIRRDGSSRFGSDKRFGFFPSASVGWRLSKESFLADANFLTDLKLRASIGVVGNQQISNYGWQGLYNVGSNYGGKPGIAPSAIPNPNLGWESTTQSNIGLDIAILNNRIQFSAEVYLKRTKDLLLQVNLPSTSGFSSSLQNVGNTQNKGLEFSLSTLNLARELRWTTNFNLSFNRNKIIKLSQNNADILQTVGDAAYYSETPVGLARVGEPIGVIYGYVATGRVYATSEEAKAANMRDGSASGPLFQAGDMQYVDLNKDGIINAASDRTIIGNANPKFTGGMTNTFSYRGFDLSFLLQWSYGNEIFNQTRLTSNRGFVFNASTTEVLRSWKKEGDITDVPRGTTSTVARNGLVSTRWMEDGSYLRAKTVTLAYNLPSSVIQKIKIKGAKVYVTGQNLFTVTKYSGLDPEVNFRSGYPLLGGIDLGVYPQTRTFLAGINLTF
ncbi:TonB-dependent receptor P3 [Dyadobacter sp. CECT 9275]|uniref:TonB-dependent receptor P3 n=1 Tax=Dyadobacter helix TaxID=2822344 RepID=A0A916JI58_9BACT|nr:TonB-dependent receptor [Dyadobacter sp. CECT 9275]CAG5012954.1 TonB-dependent receptor P3 [Dyadobacter sp. CECT 9275]